MSWPRRRAGLIGGVIALVVAAALFAPHVVDVASETLPKQLSDRAFWQMVVDFSERGGYFRSDNLVSNERTFQEVIPELRERGMGGV
jgi:hypothetical protein